MKTIESNIAKILIAPAVVLGLTLGAPVFAQDNSANTAPSASQSMNAAGESIEAAGSDTAAAAKHAYHGTKTAAKDTIITAKVKKALHGEFSGSDIHVTTVAGVVTLRGQVASQDAASRAQQLAQQTDGVANVNNQLRVVNASN